MGKAPAILLTAVLLVGACGSMYPIDVIDCGPVADPVRCSAALEVALDFADIARSQVSRIMIVDANTEATCPPLPPRCLRPDIRVELLDGEGLVLEAVPVIPTASSWVHPAQIR